MRLEAIPIGENPPYDINVVIEVPEGGVPVKYELDKDSGTLFVDRFLHTSMTYPANYGFIPHTLADDGDPLDVLVVSSTPVVPSSVIRSRTVGVLLMKDEAGLDEKHIAVPVDKLSPYHKNIASYRDLPDILLKQILHFFKHYKDLEEGKWVEVERWGSAEESLDMIRKGIEAAKRSDSA